MGKIESSILHGPSPPNGNRACKPAGGELAACFHLGDLESPRRKTDAITRALYMCTVHPVGVHGGILDAIS